MYGYGEKQYVFKQSTGKLYNFFYDERQGLCYSILSKRNNWTEPVSLQKNVFKTFYAAMDGDDGFHLLFQDSGGNIFYSKLDERETVKTSPILNSKLPSAYEKHLRIIPLKNEVHCFYVLQHGNSLILAHQLLAGGSAGQPKVVDYVIDNQLPYGVTCDRSGGLYAFYQSSDGKNLQVGYKKYIPAKKKWSEFIPVTKGGGDCEYPRAVADGRNVLHLCCQRRGSRQYELVYQQKIADKNIWTAEYVVHSSAYPFENSSIVCINETITVFWVRSDVIYFSSSENGGSSWSKPARYNFPSARQLLCLSYRTNIPQEKERASIDEIPGNLIGGLRTAFYQEAAESGANLSSEDLKNMIIESLKMLKSGIEELKDSESETRDQIGKLGQLHQLLEKEVTKNTLRLSRLENEIQRLKGLESRLSDEDTAKAPDAGDVKSSIIADIFNSVMLQEINNDIKSLKDELGKLKESLNG